MELNHNESINKIELHSCNILRWERSKHQKEVMTLNKILKNGGGSYITTNNA